MLLRHNIVAVTGDASPKKRSSLRCTAHGMANLSFKKWTGGLMHIVTRAQKKKRGKENRETSHPLFFSSFFFSEQPLFAPAAKRFE